MTETTSSGPAHTPAATPPERFKAYAVIAWLWVLVPFLWGVWELVIKVVPLFSR